METVSLNPQAAYGLQLPAVANPTTGVVRRSANDERNPAADSASPSASTDVTLSTEAQARLAAEQQVTANLDRNAPVAANQQASQADNTPNYTAGATVGQNTFGVAATSNSAQPQPVGAPTPEAPPASIAQAPAAIAGGEQTLTPAAGTAAGVPDLQPASASEVTRQVEQQAQQANVAQARQDSSPALAASGLTDNREVLSS
ncbi:MAG: hypothetical protein LBR88_11240 [Zoogloeaceae bacterium]|nr:hypothetical protein [Zoogloeaceae bacterium]